MVKWDQSHIKCECGKRATRIFLSKSERRMMANPMILFKYADGGYGPPGRSDAPTPVDAERIEIRSFADYNRVMKDWNCYERGKAEAAHERWLENKEKFLEAGRREIASQLARETDPFAKDLLRAALEREREPDRPNFREIYAEAMEHNSSNREEWWGQGETGIRGRK